MLSTALSAIKIITAKCGAWRLVLSKCLISGEWMNGMNIPVSYKPSAHRQTCMDAYCAPGLGPSVVNPSAPSHPDSGHTAGCHMWDMKSECWGSWNTCHTVLACLPHRDQLSTNNWPHCLMVARPHATLCIEEGEIESHLLQIWLMDSSAQTLIKYLGPQELCLQC